VNISRCLAVLVSTLLAASFVAMPNDASAGVRRYREYVALGDSWSADVFTTFPPTSQFVPFDCAQSVSDYPHQVARALGVRRFRDATCGSATTAHMTHSQGLPLGGTNPPQFNRLSPTTDLVTIGIGGNDIGLATAVETCLSPVPFGTPCKDKLTAGGVDTMAAAVKATGPKVGRVLRQIHYRSPKARIFLVNYLNGLPASGKSCWPVVPITDGDMAYLQKTFLAMNAMLARVAKHNHVTLIDTYRPTLGHDVCKAIGRRYVEGLVPLAVTNPLLLAFPFHPNSAGADAQAMLVTEAIRRS